MKRARALSEKETAKKTLVSFFFNLKNPTKIEFEDSKEFRTYTCLCQASRKTQHKSGYTNLWSHIEKQHPDYQEQYNRYLENDVFSFHFILHSFVFSHLSEYR